MVDEVNEANSNERRNSVGLLNLFLFYCMMIGAEGLNHSSETTLQNNLAHIVAVQ
jgi:hypothetical protein